MPLRFPVSPANQAGLAIIRFVTGITNGHHNLNNFAYPLAILYTAFGIPIPAGLIPGMPAGYVARALTSGGYNTTAARFLRRFPFIIPLGIAAGSDTVAVLLSLEKKYKDHTLTIALNYGAREEVLRAISQLSEEERQHITWEALEKHLYTAGMPDPDLIVRTSGEQRLSNYLLLQAAYSEFYFTPTYWPDFDDEAFDKAIEEYMRRTRRFGGI